MKRRAGKCHCLDGKLSVVGELSRSCIEVIEHLSYKIAHMNSNNIRAQAKAFPFASFIRSLFTILLLSGCASTQMQPVQEFADTITHAGLFTDLSKGEYDGFIAVTNLVRYGDHGLGTYDGLNGELIMYSGVVYRADATCHLVHIPATNVTPYAVVTYFQADRVFDVEKMSKTLFERALDMRRKQDRVPQAVQVSGLFKSITIRSVPFQEKPWRPLAEVIQSDSFMVTLTNVTGIMVGYHYPEYLSMMHPAGYHLHFVDSQRVMGGHVLDFEIAQARISIDHSPDLQVFLPAHRSSNEKPQLVIPPVKRP